MQPARMILISSASAFGIAILTAITATAALLLPHLVTAQPGTSIGWDLVSFFRWEGMKVFLLSTAAFVLAFATIYRRLSHSSDMDSIKSQQ